MFHKNIMELQKIRKFIDHRKIDLADYPLLSQKLDDISYTITITINDLVKCDKIVQQQGINNENEKIQKPIHKAHTR